MLLKDKPRVGVINDKIQDNTVMNGVSYFSHYFSLSLCEITYSVKRSEQNDIISHK